IACPRRVASSWRRAVELARRMSGEEICAWRAAEAIAAEALSAAGIDPLAEPSCSAEPPLPSPEVDPEEARSSTSGVDWSIVEEAIPLAVEALADGLDDAGAFELDARMRAVLRSSLAWTGSSGDCSGSSST